MVFTDLDSSSLRVGALGIILYVVLTNHKKVAILWDWHNEQKGRQADQEKHESEL